MYIFGYLIFAYALITQLFFVFHNSLLAGGDPLPIRVFAKSRYLKKRLSKSSLCIVVFFEVVIQDNDHFPLVNNDFIT